MTPRIETLPEKKLVGMRLRMTLAHNKTGELWRSFMPRRREVRDRLDTNFVSMQVFHGAPFAPDTELDKWAAVEVAEARSVPEGMEAYTIPAGMYAIFDHKGPASAAPALFGRILGAWLPASGYKLDSRPHFELLAEDYRPDDLEAEERVYIAIARD